MVGDELHLGMLDWNEKTVGHSKYFEPIGIFRIYKHLCLTEFSAWDTKRTKAEDCRVNEKHKVAVWKSHEQLSRSRYEQSN